MIRTIKDALADKPAQMSDLQTLSADEQSINYLERVPEEPSVR
ncbi:hypothetical protein [Methanosarcina sp. DH2]|nr:hypothetical protein [Methanosarcina sp. DH2]